MKQSNVIYSKTAPVPRNNTYWADVTEDPTGRTLKTYFNNKWTTITKSIQVQDLPAELTTSEDVQKGIEYSIEAAKAYTDQQITNAGLGLVVLNTSAIAILNGLDKGLSVRAIVQDEVVKQLESENISDSFDTLTEMAEYLSKHPQDVTDMNNAIKDNADAIFLIEEDYLKNSDKVQLQSNIDLLSTTVNNIETAYKDADSNIVLRVSNIENDYLTSSDKDELNNSISRKVDSNDVYDKEEIDKKLADAITGGQIDLSNYYTKSETYSQSEIDSKFENIDFPETDLSGYYTKEETDGLLDTKADNSTTYNKTEVNDLINNIPEYTLPTASANTLGGVKVGTGLFITDGVLSSTATEEIEELREAVNANSKAISSMDADEVTGYVTSVLQADGRVYADAVQTIPAEDITVADANNNFTGATVEAILNELAEMWSWEEIE